MVEGIEMSRRHGHGIIIEECTSQNDLKKIHRNSPVCDGTGLFCSLDMDASASDRVAPSTIVKVLRPFTKGLPTFKQMDFDTAPLYNHFFITLLLSKSDGKLEKKEVWFKRTSSSPTPGWCDRQKEEPFRIKLAQMKMNGSALAFKTWPPILSLWEWACV